MKHVELEQFWHAFTSRGFDSVSWAFLLLLYSLSKNHSRQTQNLNMYPTKQVKL